MLYINYDGIIKKGISKISIDNFIESLTHRYKIVDREKRIKTFCHKSSRVVDNIFDLEYVMKMMKINDNFHFIF